MSPQSSPNYGAHDGGLAIATLRVLSFEHRLGPEIFVPVSAGGHFIQIFGPPCSMSAGRIHHVMRFFRPKNVEKSVKKCCKHDVLEPLKQALLASRDVMISSQHFGSKWQRAFTLGDGCLLPKMILLKNKQSNSCW